MSWGLMRTHSVHCFCGQPFRRPIGATYHQCLDCQGKRRLLNAGFRWNDPALVRIAAWNGALFRATHADDEQGTAA